MTTNGWDTGPWRQESGELLDTWGWLTDEDLAFITGRRPRPAATHDDVAVRTPAGTRTQANPRAATPSRERRHRTR